jgi:hypothetical protein
MSPGEEEEEANQLKKLESNTSTRKRNVSDAAMEKNITPESGTSNEGDDSELERRESIVQTLARRYTTQSHADGTQGRNPFLESDENSPLNPHSSEFNARAWTKAIVDMDTGSLRTSGVCFQHLNVHGFGAATDYQKDVANVWAGVGGLVKKAVGAGKPRKIDILRDFDGATSPSLFAYLFRMVY